MQVLITGGAGFIGSNFAIQYKKNNPSDEVICLDNLLRRGSEINRYRLEEHEIKFEHGDVRNEQDLEKYEPNVIVEASAEPSVMSGIEESPNYLIKTNLIGAINCLELARKNNSKFVFLSTSRIYPYTQLNNISYFETATRFIISEKNIEGINSTGISETFTIEGKRTLYGATKLAAELIINEYNTVYELPTVINRLGVITGPWQMGKTDQGIFSLWIAKHFFKQQLKYIGFKGTGKQVRDLLHITDLCELVEDQIKNMEQCNGRTYNVGGGLKMSLSLLETTKLCQEITENKIQINKEKENRPGDIPIYITDNTKITSELKWKPKRTPQKTLEDMYKWIKKHENELKKILK